MVQYTNPTLSALVKGLDLTAADVYVTVSNRARSVTVTIENPTLTLVGEDTKVTVELSQQESGKFPANSVADMIVNYWVDGKRHATKLGQVRIQENLLKGVVDIE